jgi:hypothetical protein
MTRSGPSAATQRFEYNKRPRIAPITRMDFMAPGRVVYFIREISVIRGPLL